MYEGAAKQALDKLHSELLEAISLAKNEEHLKIAAKEETNIAKENIELVKNELQARTLSL